MPRAEPGKRAEARRLVEDQKLSLVVAAERLGLNASTVRAWQKQDEKAGDPWTMHGLSAAQHDRQAGLPEEERRAATERGRRSTTNRWADRRSQEADYFGTLTGGIRQTAAEAITAARTAIAMRDADDTVKWARALRDFAVTGGIFGDKADKFAGLASSPSVVAISDDTYRDDLAEVLSLVDRIDRERHTG